LWVSSCSRRRSLLSNTFTNRYSFNCSFSSFVFLCFDSLCTVILLSCHIAFSQLVYAPQLTVFGLYLRIPDRQFGMRVPFQTFYQGLPVLHLVVVGPEQFGVYGSSEAQPGFYQLSCKQ
ncbi:hypothetical protein T12_15331, partial [Trichinella patagoniensis]